MQTILELSSKKGDDQHALCKQKAERYRVYVGTEPFFARR
jgi:hypothetical protein